MSAKYIQYKIHRIQYARYPKRQNTQDIYRTNVQLKNSDSYDIRKKRLSHQCFLSLDTYLEQLFLDLVKASIMLFSDPSSWHIKLYTECVKGDSHVGMPEDAKKVGTVPS